MRKEYLDFFVKQNHFIYDDQGILPKNDDSLLWVNAGIVPLKKFFLEQEKPPAKSLVSIQQCIRVKDIDLIGKSNHHHTLFQMFGFFSIGSYFKETAIKNTFSFLRHIRIDISRIYITIHPDDKESLLILKKLGFNAKKIYKLKSNFWDLGSGPCGPCLEVFYDKGTKYGNYSSKSIENEKDNDRFVEIMNIVFSSFNHVKDNFKELKIKKIDMGGGFERLLAALNDVPSAYETDIFKEAIKILNRCNKGAKPTSLRIIVDHLRAVYSMMYENILPGHKNQNYIVRMLLKRIAMQLYFSRITGALEKVDDVLIALLKPLSDTIPKIFNGFSRISLQIKKELEYFINSIESQKNSVLALIEKNVNAEVDAKSVFHLYDTKGVDINIIRQVFSEHNKTYSVEKFNDYLAEHKKISHNVNFGIGYGDNSVLESKVKQTLFIGYGSVLESHEEIQSIISIKNGLWVVFLKTPFYPKGGGQTNDTGEIIFKQRHFPVTNVIAQNNVIFHFIKDVNKKNFMKEGTRVLLKVDSERRQKIEANHSATHLLHYYLRECLGPGTLQAGSANNEFRLRFDFTVQNKLQKSQLIRKLEELVLGAIRKNLTVKDKILTLRLAKKEGFLLTFLEEYTKFNELRGVIIGPSKELCVGTHVDSTQEIQDFVIKNFKSKGANTYRILALTGRAAIDFRKQKNIPNKNKKEKFMSLQENDILEITLIKKNYRLLKIKKLINRTELLNYYDRKFKNNKETIFFVYGNELNHILICVNGTTDPLIENLEKKKILKGGGNNQKFMGKLQVSLDSFVEILNSY